MQSKSKEARPWTWSAAKEAEEARRLIYAIVEGIRDIKSSRDITRLTDMLTAARLATYRVRTELNKKDRYFKTGKYITKKRKSKS